MSEIRGTQLTYLGLSLLAKCQTGQELHFSRVAMGDGKAADSQDLRQLTGLINPKLNLPIKSVTVSGVGTTIMETELKNVNLAAGFFAKEVGIFAMDGTTEILYAVRNTGDDSEYIPAGGGSEIWDLIYDVVTVVDQADNITATINGDIAYVTRLDFNEHVDSINPHPNAPSLKTEVTTADRFWAQNQSDNHLHPISLDNARNLILGDQASTIPTLRNRVNQLEIEQSNIALKLVAENDCPDSNLLLAEDFVVPDKIDTFTVQVLSIVAGDNGIDVETLTGIIPGAWYWVTDGVNQEYIQIKSCIKNGSVYRILVNSNIINTYSVPDTIIYRTTAEIDNTGVAYGAGDKKGFNWAPNITWSGVSANVATTAVLATTQTNADTFVQSGDVAFTSDGLFTLSAN